nr:protein FAM210B, mitochondrial [Vicugna pacos]
MGEMKFGWAIVKGGVTHHRPQDVVWHLVDRLLASAPGGSPICTAASGAKRTPSLLPQCASPSLVCAQDPRKITVTTGGDINSTEGEKLSKSQQLKKIFQEYGAVGVSLHIGLSLISLGMFYMVVSSGVDMSAILLKLGFKESLVQSKMAAGTSTFVVAYAIHKLFAPVRISITLVSVPLIVRYFRKVGFFKPPAAKP